jgi:hypothetical protein
MVHSGTEGCLAVSSTDPQETQHATVRQIGCRTTGTALDCIQLLLGSNPGRDIRYPENLGRSLEFLRGNFQSILRFGHYHIPPNPFLTFIHLITQRYVVSGIKFSGRAELKAISSCLRPLESYVCFHNILSVRAAPLNKLCKKT